MQREEAARANGTMTDEQIRANQQARGLGALIGGAVVLDAWTGFTGSKVLGGTLLAGDFYDNPSTSEAENQRRNQQLKNDVAWGVMGAGAMRIGGALLETAGELSSAIRSAVPKFGTYSNVQAREWYLGQEAKIPSLINNELSLEDQAKQAFGLRNIFRTTARELMADRNLAAKLNVEEPNMTWDQVVKKYSDKGFSGDELYKKIIGASQRSRQSVNESLGVKPKTDTNGEHKSE